jgi:hypothetical protein
LVLRFFDPYGSLSDNSQSNIAAFRSPAAMLTYNRFTCMLLLLKRINRLNEMQPIMEERHEGQDASVRVKL